MDERLRHLRSIASYKLLNRRLGVVERATINISKFGEIAMMHTSSVNVDG